MGKWIVRIAATSVIVLLAFEVLMHPLSASRDAARLAQCRNNLKQIAVALHQYHDLYGSFPPAYIADENGKPLHSWRVHYPDCRSDWIPGELA